MSCFYTVIAKVKSWRKSEFIPKLVREPVGGQLTTITVLEASMYTFIKDEVKAGLLPGYFIYLFMSLVTMAEVVLNPLVTWIGYNNRKRIFFFWSFAILFVPWLWLFTPSPDNIPERGFCNSNITLSRYEGLSGRESFRVLVVFLTAVTISMAKAALWGHYAAYTDDHAPERSCVHIGLIILMKVLSITFYQALSPMLGVMNDVVSILITSVLTIVNIIRLYFGVPVTDPEMSDKRASMIAGRGYFTSIKRILFNLTAMSQMIALGLLAGALWGFGFHEPDIVRMNYNLTESREGIFSFNTHFFRNAATILAVVYMGVKYSVPIKPTYNMLRGLQVAFKSSLFLMIAYIVIILAPACNKGVIGGLTDSSYINPQCSLACGCVGGWDEYSPVCVVETMTTYLSPCEAGCSGSNVVDNLLVYTNCSCSSNGFVSPGACSDYSCQSSYNFHVAFYTIILAVSVVSFQAQAMVILRSVDPRDKSIATGIMLGVVGIITFICGNNLFLYISTRTCLWESGGRCQMHSSLFGYFAAAICATFCFVALAVNVITRKYITWCTTDTFEDSDA